MRGQGSDLGLNRCYIILSREFGLHVVLFQIYNYESYLKVQYQAEKSQNLISGTDVTGRISDLKVGSQSRIQITGSSS